MKIKDVIFIIITKLTNTSLASDFFVFEPEFCYANQAKFELIL